LGIAPAQLIPSPLGALQKMATDYFNLDDVPNETLESISEKLFTYTVALLEVVHDMPGLDTVRLLGSATLVEVEGCRGLITAEHVVSTIS